MMGNLDNEDGLGLIPRMLRYMFDLIVEKVRSLWLILKEKVNVVQREAEEAEVQCRCSFLEIYNENLYDLLEPEGQVGLKPSVGKQSYAGQNIVVREDTRRGVYVENLQEEQIETTEDALEVGERA